MKALIIATTLALTTAGLLRAQVQTTETRTTETQTTVDSTSNKVVTTETVQSLRYDQDLTSHKHMISIDPIRFGEMFNVTYAYAPGTGFAYGGTIDVSWQNASYSSYGAGIETRYYPSGRGFRSFHLVGGLAYHHIEETEPYWDNTGQVIYTKTSTIDPIGISAGLGWHFYPWDDFAIEALLGGVLTFNGNDRETLTGSGEITRGPEMLNTTNGMTPMWRFQVGYAW